nr:MAG TPA: hypothetical protein [Bacteriophage sp.]
MSTKFEDFVNQYKVEPINDAKGNIQSINFLLNGETINVNIKTGTIRGFVDQPLSFI